MSFFELNQNNHPKEKKQKNIFLFAKKLLEKLRSILIYIISAVVIGVGIFIFYFYFARSLQASISEVTATSSQTLDQTSYTAVNSMSVTPGAGSYLAVFTMQVTHNSSPGSNVLRVSIFNNGSQETESERELTSDSSLNSAVWTVTSHAYVTVGAGESVDARYLISASPSFTAANRSLVLFPVTSSDVTEVSATGDDTETSATYTLMDSMSITAPSTSDYLLVFSTSLLGPVTSNNEQIDAAVYVNGSIVQHTERSIGMDSSVDGVAWPTLIAAKVSPTTGQTVEIRWRNSGTPGGTLTARERTLTLIKVESGELFEASDTTTDSDTSASDEIVDSMTLTPGAGNYLALYSSSEHLGAISANKNIDYSFYVNSSQTASSEREFMMEESIDDKPIPVYLSGKVSTGTNQTVEVKWRGNDTTSRDNFERSLILIKEPESLTETPVLYLKFNDATGTTAQDSTPNNNDGAISGPIWRTSPNCLSDTCLYFDGVNDIVTVTNANAIDLDAQLANGFSVSVWIRPNGAGEGTGGQIFYKGTNTWLRVDTITGEKLDVQASLDLATTDATLNVSAKVDNQKWNHVLLSYTDDGDDEITIWVNGKNAGSSADGSGAPASDANDLLIGGTTTNNYQGFIDEFKIYDQEKTEAEIKSLILKTSSSKGSSVNVGPDLSIFSSGLEGYWMMEEATANTCAGGTNDSCDSSGNKNDAAWNGNTTPAPGKFGLGTTFDGTGDFIDAGDIGL